MNELTVKAAKLHAQRFLSRVKDLESKMETEAEPGVLFYGSKETAALRRSSLDLTRALANLRRPG